MGIKKVMACVDFSYITPKVLELAGELSKKYQADLCLIYVVEERMPRLAQEMLDLHTLYDRLKSAATTRLQEYKRELKERLQLEVESKILEGEPFEAILDYIEETSPDVVIVGAHGKKGMRRIFLGSVSEKVARKSPVNVIIVKY